MSTLAPFVMATIIPDFPPSVSCLTPWLVVTGALLLLLYRNRRGQ